MPCSHLPRHGGPYHPAWSRPAPTSPPLNPNAMDSAVGAGQEEMSRDDLENEIARLRDELNRARRQSTYMGSASPPMVWLALGVCAVMILFACIAVCSHG